MIMRVWFAGLFALAAVACLWAAHQALSLYDAEIRRPLVVFLGLTAGWAVSNAFLVLPVPVSVMYISYLVGLVVGLLTVVAWLWFCSAYAGAPHHYNGRVRVLTIGALVVVIAAKLTNPLHELYFRPRVAAEPFRHFAPDPGFLYWLVAGGTYVGAAIGIYLLFDMYNSSRFETTRLTILTALIGLPVVPKLGAVVWSDQLLLVFYEPIGAAIFAVGIVTAAKDTFLSVRAPARRQLADALSELVVIVDGQGRLADYNQSAERMFGDLAGTLGEPVETAIPPLAAHEVPDELLELQTGVRTRYYRFRTSAISLGDNTIGRAYVLSDVTELEAQRRQLKQQTEHMEALTGEIAHQLRNPLTILQGRLELLQADQDSVTAQDEGPLHGSVNTAMDAVAHIEAITDDLISAVNYGKPVSDVEPLELTDVIESALTGDEHSSVTVQLNCKESLRLRAERIRCIELFRLLLLVHSQRGATTVSIECSGSQLTVSSDGDQFTTETPEDLFEYGNETAADSRVHLANARTLAQAHGWSIHADVERETPAIVLDGVTFLTNDRCATETEP